MTTSSGGYSCPECREEFRERPALLRNLKLWNIVENFLPPQPGHEDIGIFCTYCVDAPVPAVKSCLHCEASLCDKHLRFHSKSPEHVITDPGTSLGDRKCSEHKKILEYYCTEDAACVCVSCYVIGQHKGHQMDSLDKASGKKKEELKAILQKVTTREKDITGRVQALKGCKTKLEEEAAWQRQRVAALFKDLRRELEDLERSLLSEISTQTKQRSLLLSDLIGELEMKKAELSTKMRHIEELCNTSDPLTVLQKSDTTNISDTEDQDHEDKCDKQLYDGGCLDMTSVSNTLHTGLSKIISKVKRESCLQEAADIDLDVNTANCGIHISRDQKTVSRSSKQSYPKTPERFSLFYQVLSIQSFSKGLSYWEVDVGGSKSWRVGMSYPSIDRDDRFESRIGDNKKSWCLKKHDDMYAAVHAKSDLKLSDKISSNRLRICLDYEAGQISFYDLCDPVREIYTFTDTFTEPLHAAVGIWEGCIRFVP